MSKYTIRFLFLLFIIGCKSENTLYDIVIKNGIIYDGTGDKSYKSNIGIKGDKIAYLNGKPYPSFLSFN